VRQQLPASTSANGVKASVLQAHPPPSTQPSTRMAALQVGGARCGSTGRKPKLELYEPAGTMA